MSTHTLLKLVAAFGFLVGAAAGFISVSPVKKEIEEKRSREVVKLPPELEHRKPHPLSPAQIAGRTNVKDVGVTGSGESSQGVTGSGKGRAGGAGGASSRPG